MSNIGNYIQMKTETEESEAQALADILTWSHDCPEWQRDALRRLCTKGELDDDDLDELTELCKGGGKGSVPLAADHRPDPKAAASTVIRRTVDGIENIHALKPGELLTFDKAGLTIIYGDNGAGKSGYARILKKACRARIPPKGDKVLPNIYSATAEPQKAMIDFSVNGHNKSQSWSGYAPTNPLLSAVSVFDSRTANVHVDEANDVAYTPFPMQVLERLAEAAQEVKKRISEEIRELERQTPETIMNPECHPDTGVHRLISALKGSTKEEDIRSLATLNDKERARYETLKIDLGTEPKRVARQVEMLKNRLNAASLEFESLQNAVSEEKVARLTGLYRRYQTAQEASRAAAEDLFTDEPLPNIGANVWRDLWEAARRYSEQQAYPAFPFPMTSDGARCVLCQQELGAEAKDRLSRFESFVQDETKHREEHARKDYQATLDELVAANVPAIQVPAVTALIRDGLNDNELAPIIRRIAVRLKWRWRKIRRDHTKSDDMSPYPHAESWPTNAITAHRNGLEQRIAALRTEDESEERKQMRAELDEFSDRNWLSAIQKDVVAEIARRKKRKELESVLKDTTTNRITTKSGDIAKRLVTNALRARFSKEIDQLGVSRLKIELKKERGSYGAPYFRVSLSRKPDAQVGEILSEGEHRCVALAAFLAELATNESRSAIVFDDPVSSLDHIRREAVAERLVDEGKHRQVIVLTHDIAFLFLLDQAARRKAIHMAFRSVTRTEKYTGFIQQDPPLHAQPIDKVINLMQKQLDSKKMFYENGDHDEWERTVDALQKRLRWTWERAVEEAISPVFKRMSERVQTKGLLKITVLTLDDCTEMREAYGRCSSLLHSSPDTLSPVLSKPRDVLKEIETLRKWVKDIRKRQEDIGRQQ